MVDFFKAHKISTAVAAHFTNAGYDTLDTLTTLSPDSLVDVEAFNNVKWLPGHKVRLQQIFAEISARVRAYRQQHPRTRDHYGPGSHHMSHQPTYVPQGVNPQAVGVHPRQLALPAGPTPIPGQPMLMAPPGQIGGVPSGAPQTMLPGQLGGLAAVGGCAVPSGPYGAAPYR